MERRTGWCEGSILFSAVRVVFWPLWQLAARAMVTVMSKVTHSFPPRGFAAVLPERLPKFDVPQRCLKDASNG